MQQDRDRPHVSIAMATYNGERFLPEQLESFLTQTRLPDELVVCDDGSTDATLDVLRAFAARASFPVRIHANPTRLGWRENFFKAASLCEGDWIAFSDQDDVWLPEKLERCLGALSRSGALLAVHQVRVVDQNLNPTGATQPDVPRDPTPDPTAWVPWRVVQGLCMVASHRLFHDFDPRRRPPDFRKASERYAHDQWALLVAQALGRVVLMSDELALYRQHGGNVCGSPDVGWTRIVRHAPGVGFSAYRGLCRASLRISRCLETLGNSASAVDALALGATAARYRRRARLNLCRAQLYHPLHGTLWRVRVLTGLMLRADYRAAQSGGLGGRSFVKDLMFGLLPRRASPDAMEAGQ